MEISKITIPDEWCYFAKGNANILFNYTGTNDYLRHKLLRLRLLKEDEQYISTCELYDFIELKCKHLFPKQIIDIQLVVLTRDFVDRLDSAGHRVKLLERYGLLIPNILDGNYTKYSLSKNCHLYVGDGWTSSGQGKRSGADRDTHNDSTAQTVAANPPNQKIESVVFEIKPKWLYDNTSCRYCRTCSHNQLRGFSRHFCPLDLLYDHTIDRGIDDILTPVPAPVLKTVEQNCIPVRLLLRIFLSDPSNVFVKLKEYQRINNKNDLIANLTLIHDVLQNLLLVMTLRDVGLFIKIERYDRTNNHHNSHNNIHNIIDVPDYGKFVVTCNIYDLDLKSKSKYKHWLDIENKLQSIYNSYNPAWRDCIRVEADGPTFEI